MGSSVAKLLVLIAAVVQAMPAGACCLPAPRQAENKAVAQVPENAPACCRKKAEAAAAAQSAANRLASQTATHCAPTSGRSPVSPSFTCCCSQRVATPQDPVRAPDHDQAAPLAADLTVVPQPQPELAALAPEVRPPGPPVRILLGVWRC